MQIRGPKRGDKRSTWLIGRRTKGEENIVVASSVRLRGRWEKGRHVIVDREI